MPFKWNTLLSSKMSVYLHRRAHVIAIYLIELRGIYQVLF